MTLDTPASDFLIIDTVSTGTGTETAAGRVRVLAPLARDVVRSVAVEHGVCVRPVPMRRVDLATGVIPGSPVRLITGVGRSGKAKAVRLR